MNNNRGWGLNEMIILCCILIGFLILAVVMINQLYTDLQDVEQDNQRHYGYTYSEIEANMVNSAKKYFKNNKEVLYITSDELLQNNYITSIELTPYKKGEPCIGYVQVEDGIHFKSYISCEEYETNGY